MSAQGLSLRNLFTYFWISLFKDYTCGFYCTSALDIHTELSAGTRFWMELKLTE